MVIVIYLVQLKAPYYYAPVGFIGTWMLHCPRSFHVDKPKCAGIGFTSGNFVYRVTLPLGPPCVTSSISFYLKAKHCSCIE